MFSERSEIQRRVPLPVTSRNVYYLNLSNMREKRTKFMNCVHWKLFSSFAKLRSNSRSWKNAAFFLTLWRMLLCFLVQVAYWNCWWSKFCPYFLECFPSFNLPYYWSERKELIHGDFVFTSCLHTKILCQINHCILRMYINVVYWILPLFKHF